MLVREVWFFFFLFKKRAKRTRKQMEMLFFYIKKREIEFSNVCNNREQNNEENMFYPLIMTINGWKAVSSSK
jgi:hypothetical protein